VFQEWIELLIVYLHRDMCVMHCRLSNYEILL